MRGCAKEIEKKNTGGEGIKERKNNISRQQVVNDEK